MNEQTRAFDPTDVIVGGGGIMGCAAAYYLAKRGLRVRLFDKGRLAWEQSSRNWGFVKQTNRGHIETPIMVLGLRLWRELAAELGEDVGWIEGGGLSLAQSEAELAPMEAAAAISREYGVDARIVSRTEVQALIPGMEGPFVGGLYNPADGLATPLQATLAFAHAAERLGAQLHPHCAVEGLLSEGGRITGVRTAQGEARAATVICAAGAHSRVLARMVGLNLPVRGIRATVGATPPMAPLTRLSVFGKAVCFRQFADGTVTIARTNLGSADFDMTLEAFRNMRLFLPTFFQHRDLVRLHVGRPLWEDIKRRMPWSPTRRHPFADQVDLEPPPNEDTVEACRRAFMTHFPQLGEIRIARTWAGIIDSTPDLVPVFGPVQARPGLWFATGFSGHGFGMGPPMGYLLAEWLAEGRPSLELGPMRFERFAEGDMAPLRPVV
jgi:glycine/D-amino acid oxidase-like deaminating enzyme